MSVRRFIIVVNLGTPEEASVAAVRSFLAEFLSDPAVIDFPRWLWQPILRGIILRSRPPRVARLYREIWTPEGSPLEVDTRRIADGIESLAPADTAVRWAYRYGRPSLDACLREASGHAGAEIVVVPLYVHRTSSTTGTVVDRARDRARSLGVEDRLRVEALEPDDPGFVKSNVARFHAATRGELWEPQHLLISFHGIPLRYDRREGRQYSHACERSFAAIVAALRWDPAHATLAYQSKFGPERWLTPATAELLEKLPRENIRRLAVMTPGFLTEGLETMEEIGMQGRKAFLAAGGTHLVRVPCPGAHPALLESLLRLAMDGPGSP